MIPKIIHFCWFGNNTLPKSVKKHIETWKEYLPDYEIKEWNEDNFDINMFQFTREAYEKRKFAFVADVCRLFALYKDGGIYFDTDVEVLKNMDALLVNPFFIGLETIDRVGTSVIGTEKDSLLIKKLLAYYDKIPFVNTDGTFNTRPNTLIISDILQEKSEKNYKIYPVDYFSPLNFETKKLNITKNTYSIHHFDGTWLPMYRQRETIFWTFLRLKDRQLLFRALRKIKIVQ